MTTVVNISHGDAYDVRIDRTTKWGNPASHRIGTRATVIVASRAESLAYYEKWLDIQLREGILNLAELENKILGCWCKPKSCHGDILIRKIHQNDEKPNLFDLVL